MVKTTSSRQWELCWGVGLASSLARTSFESRVVVAAIGSCLGWRCALKHELHVKCVGLRSSNTYPGSETSAAEGGQCCLCATEGGVQHVLIVVVNWGLLADLRGFVFIELSEDVCARSGYTIHKHIADVRACVKEVMMHPFSLSSPVLLLYSINPQEMTRRGSG